MNEGLYINGRSELVFTMPPVTGHTFTIYCSPPGSDYFFIPFPKRQITHFVDVDVSKMKPLKFNPFPHNHESFIHESLSNED